MQSENFDKKVRDSLSQRPPGNDKPAWDKMEPLLDKHMPQEKNDRRRIFFILFAFLLLGGGAFLIWQNRRENKNQISSVGSQQNSSSPEKSDPNADQGLTIHTNGVKENGSQVNPKNTTDQSTTKQSESGIGIADKTAPSDFKSIEAGIKKPSITKPKNDKHVYDPISSNPHPGGQQTQIKRTENKPDVAKQEVINPDASTPAIANVQDQAKDANVPKAPVDVKKPEERVESKESQPKATAKSKTRTQKVKRSFLDNVFFSLSAGADLSTVGIDNAGTVKPITGAGIGYQVSNKFSIRSGFYSARKVYEAAPDEYHPPYDLAAYYPNLKGIDANCKVYEIPVTIDFTISNNKRHSWFASAGLSSLIMKEEVYDYYYKPNTSPTYITYRRTIKDQNKHYFSVLNLSGGYRKEINRNISLQAEPYMKIATNGVGYGKVKLNSGGVMVSAVIKPFAKKR